MYRLIKLVFLFIAPNSTMNNQTTLPPLPAYYSADKLSTDTSPPSIHMPDPLGAFPAIKAAWGQNKPFRLDDGSFVDVQQTKELVLAQLDPNVSPQMRELVELLFASIGCSTSLRL